MLILAPAKLNLYLNITGKRADGYHLLDSLFVFLDLADELKIEEAEETKIVIKGAVNDIVSANDNTVSRTIALIKKHSSITRNVSVSLTKNIPVSAGLGGGSSDAATTIIALNQLWNLRLSLEEMIKLGVMIGADVPAFLYAAMNKTNACIVRGIGEIISPAPQQPSYHFLLVNPRKPLSTKEVFSNFSRKIFLPKNTNINDLEEPAITLMPEIKDILQSLIKQPGCITARMSGSGATCFGIFRTKEEAAIAKTKMNKEYLCILSALQNV